MTKIVDHIQNAKGKTLFSIEILPPMKGHGVQSLFNEIEPLMEFDPKFINVTYHREEFQYKKRENGLLEKISIKKRPGTVGICAALMNKFHVDTVPHIICGGFTKEETENALIDLQFLGIDNVLALRGDAIKSENRFAPTDGGHSYATELIEQINNMNKGKYLSSEIENAYPTDFCIGVAGYPEKHFEAPNFQTDLKYLKQKVEMGAEYIVTQMFFDNNKYFDFVARCRDAGINIPIIPGLKSLKTARQLTILPSIFHIDLPDDLVAAVEDCKNKEDIKKVGVEWAIQQSKELKERGAPCIHYYSMGKSDDVVQIAKEIF
ncbi:MAG: methylenetetrahydrofolate reductase [NAD(P)H] [Halobacteriovoraceae bacterium]|nr:methylenetetrahydrofolate reductase [NAD(P)H] [Halobacteriovoraceae bacterium]|tara:strand:- start:10567 stop:11526 length:960 start_codon:yes stop_codon:yes gene_type:complete